MTKPTKEMLKEYEAIAKKSNRDMKGCIKAHLFANCPKFAGHEDKFDECIEYVTECAKEILKNRPGDVADDACYKMARDFFNDELWDKDEKKTAKKAEEEQRAKEKAEKEKKAPGKSAKAKKKAPARPTNPAPEPEPEKAETEKPVAIVPEEPVTAGSLVKNVADKNRLIIEANNKKLGIGLAETIDLFGTGK